MNILGIYREEIFSPGKIQEDKEIMNDTLTEISKFGGNIKAIHPDVEAIPEKCDADLVLNMAQSGKTLSILSRWEKDGVRIINSSHSVINCYRRNMVRLLKENQIPMPRSWIYELEVIKNELSLAYASEWIGAYWIKRGDFHALEPGDVAKVTSLEQMEKILMYFKKKGVNQVVIQEHVEGEVIKFYGVGDVYIKAFFLPDNQDIKIDQKTRDIILKAIKCLELEIYGGDMILEPNGNILLIDINDWPSFSLCRKEAAKEIADYTKRIMEDFNELSIRISGRRQ